MAYLRELIRRECDCGKRATVEVFGHGNESYGLKCVPCGQRLVRTLNEEKAKGAD